MRQNDEQQYLTYKAAFADQVLPAAWIDMALLDTNIAEIKARSGSTPIRLASKSIRCRHILRYILDADPQFQGIMCYHPQEAAFLAEHGFDDLLIAYPSVCTQSLQAALLAAKSGKRIYFMVDGMAQIQLINRLASELQVTALLCLDLDMSVDFPGLYFGVYRSPIRNADDAVKLYRQLAACTNVNLCALMGYEAQIAGVGEKVPGKGLENKVVEKLKRKAIPIVAERRRQTLEALRNEGAQITLVNGGGTGSIESTIAEPWVTEVTVGSGFYTPHLFDYYKAFRHQPAAGFAVPVVRQARRDVYTCQGGGYIASGTASPLRQPVVHLPKKTSYIKNEAFGEVQTPLRYRGKLLSIGDPVFMRHCKAGELCERFNTVHLLRHGRIEKTVPTYRGEGQCYV